MLQRVGRTGRKRDGKIVLLLTEGKEELAYDQSNTKYLAVQKTIKGQQGKKLYVCNAYNMQWNNIGKCSMMQCVACCRSESSPKFR